MITEVEERRDPKIVKSLHLIASLGILLCCCLLLIDLNKLRTDSVQNLRIDYLMGKHGQDRREEKRFPSCIIIGARKCGTRALLQAMAAHPDIGTARHEVHYFDWISNYRKGLDWYRQQMPMTRRGRVIVEKTPGYLTSREAPARLAAFNRRVRLIVIVRDPVVRAVSDYTQVHYNRLAKNVSAQPPFADSAFTDDGTLNIQYKPVRNSLYAIHMKRWLKHFSMTDILVLDGDAFIGNPLTELAKVETFLGLPHKIGAHQLYFNRTKGFYCFKSHNDSKARCLGDTKGRPHVDIGQKAEMSLRRQLNPFNQLFFRMIGRHFDW